MGKNRRPTPRHTGHADPQSRVARTAPWIRRVASHPADLGRRSGDSARIPISGALPVGTSGTHRGRMGSEREQPAGEILHADRRGTAAPAGGNRGLEPAVVCHCRGFEHNTGGGMTCWPASVLCSARSRSRDDFEAGMTEELRFHIEQYTEELVRSRNSPGRSAPARAHGVRRDRHGQERLPRGARPPDFR